MTHDYGTLNDLVKATGAIVSASAAIALAWRGRTRLEPSEADLPGGPQKVGALLTSIAIALIWAQFSDARFSQKLYIWSIILAITCVISLLVYGFLIGTQTFSVGKRPKKVIGGFVLSPKAKTALDSGVTIAQLKSSGSSRTPRTSASGRQAFNINQLENLPIPLLLTRCLPSNASRASGSVAERVLTLLRAVGRQAFFPINDIHNSRRM